MHEFFRRVGYLLSRHRRRRELEDEMVFHREMAERSGVAERKRSFGNPLQLQEQAREAWGWTWIEWFDRLLQDLRYATRMLARAPGFTVAAILILAIGIGINVATFSFFNFAFWQPLPIKNPATLLRLERRTPDYANNFMPNPAAVFFSDHAKTLSAVLTLMPDRLELDREVKPVSANFVSANYFQELGATASYGRLFDPARDDAENAPPVAVMGYDFWQNHFAADPSVIGKVIALNRHAVTVVGIEPRAFPSLQGNPVDVWVPIRQQPALVDGSKALTDPSSPSVTVWGRLAPGATAKMAEAELLSLTNERRKQYPKEVWKGEFIHSEPGGRQTTLNPRNIQAFLMFGTLTLLILASACANLGGLLLARGVAREHEVSIRLAIGANRTRIFRQLFTESLLLAVLGSVTGLILARVALTVLMVEANGPRWWTATPDWRVTACTVGMTLLASLLFGLAPALQLARQKHKRTRMRQLLVGAQVAISCVLLIVASLLVRSAQHLIYSDPGFGYEQVISVSPGLSAHGYKPAAAQAYLDELQTRLRTLPGIATVSLARFAPLGGSVSRVESKIDGKTIEIYPNSVSREYFPVMEIPILLGRNFLPGEKNAVIVSQSLAQKQWPGENPLGKIYWDKDVVVGVAGNTRIGALYNDEAVELYSPVAPEELPSMSVVLRTNGAPDGLTPVLKAMVQNLDPKLFPEISLLRASYRETTRSGEILVSIFSAVGFLSVLLAGIGILGLVAYTISQRSKEIAIRLALGSPAARALAAVLGQFGWPVVLGLGVGFAFTLAFSRVLRFMLFGVNHLDPISYAAAAAIMLAMVALAALLPSRRALRLDIARTLHEE
jgi:predicted permease